MDVRAQAALLLGDILRNRGSLTTLLPIAAERVAVKDRALLQEFCYGVCRWYPRLDKIISQLMQKPLRGKDADIQALLALGLYQLIFLRIPDHAALNATVAAAQALKKVWAKKLINGVLRQFLRDRDQLEQRLGGDSIFQTAHPSWLLEQFQQAWQKNIDTIVKTNNQTPPFTLRINQQRTSRDDYLKLLDQNDIEAVFTPFSDVGLTLKQAVPVTSLPEFAAGFVSVQDEAPQLCANLLQCESHHRVLDACSAPGGKTAHLLESLPDLQLTALDISDRRVQRIRENLQRLGLHAELVVGDATQPSAWWDGEAFDRILLDAPCTATGIIRRQPDIKILRRPESLTKLVDTQWQLLNALWPLLKRGGQLLYATCSILPDENSRLIERFVREQADARHEVIEASWGMTQNCGRQLLPQMDGHDGFYYARLFKH